MERFPFNHTSKSVTARSSNTGCEVTTQFYEVVKSFVLSIPTARNEWIIVMMSPITENGFRFSLVRLSEKLIV